MPSSPLENPHQTYISIDCCSPEEMASLRYEMRSASNKKRIEQLRSASLAWNQLIGICCNATIFCKWLTYKSKAHLAEKRDKSLKKFKIKKPARNRGSRRWIAAGGLVRVPSRTTDALKGPRQKLEKPKSLIPSFTELHIYSGRIMSTNIRNAGMSVIGIFVWETGVLGCASSSLSFVSFFGNHPSVN